MPSNNKQKATTWKILTWIFKTQFKTSTVLNLFVFVLTISRYLNTRIAMVFEQWPHLSNYLFLVTQRNLSYYCKSSKYVQHLWKEKGQNAMKFSRFWLCPFLLVLWLVEKLKDKRRESKNSRMNWINQSYLGNGTHGAKTMAWGLSK